MSCGALTCTSFTNGTVSNAELNYLDGATSNVQTQINTANTNISTNATNIATNVTDIDALEVKTTQQSYTTNLTTFSNDVSCANLTCTSFTNGTVSDAELNYLDNATSNIQTQLNSIVTVNNTQNTDIDNLETKTTQ